MAIRGVTWRSSVRLAAALAAVAPRGFGAFGGDLLVGNFGDGHVNAYDLDSGRFEGGLAPPDGSAVVIDGLWGIRFGNGNLTGPEGTLFFAAGINGEADGLFGTLRPARG
jgi:uncharacterized protein (TIGR03118 family)